MAEEEALKAARKVMVLTQMAGLSLLALPAILKWSIIGPRHYTASQGGKGNKS